MGSPEVNIDFRISSDLYYLHIEDLSCWGIVANKPAIIEITVPGYRKPIKKYFDKRDTSYDASNLDMVCGDTCPKTELPDGVYNIVITASPGTFSQEYNYLKLDKFEKDFDKLRIESLMKECQDCSRKQLNEIEFRIKAAKSLVMFSRVSEASDVYKTARKMLDKLLNCKDC